MIDLEGTGLLLRLALEQGFLFALVTIGLVISFRVVRFPDLTVDGSFVLGASVMGVCTVAGTGSLLGSFLGFVSGMAAGLATGVLGVKLGINRLLSGILVMTGLYSVNLRVLGRSNLPLSGENTVVSWMENVSWIGRDRLALPFAILTLFLAAMIGFLLHTEFGLYLRAVGENANLVTSLGRSPDAFVLCGLALSNGLIGLSGAMTAQHFGFVDVNMGTGLIITGLAMLYLGDALVKRDGVLILLAAGVFGSIVFQAVKNVLLRIGLAPTDLKLATAVLVGSLLYVRGLRGRSADEFTLKD